MKQFNKTKIAAAVGTAALAMTLGAPANAAISLGGDNGWEVTYGGFVNLFYTQSDFENIGGVAGADEDSSHLTEGLLPAFHTFTVKSPTINGLTGTGQITFAPDSSGSKQKRLNKFGQEIDMREVFFNVDGSFGTISAGRTLALFQRQAILKDYTLFGVGAVAGPDSGGTSLGRIGFGYVYPDFRTRFAYTTPNINGFQLSVGVFDPQEAGGGLTGGANIAETDTPQFQAEATYNTAFGGGNISAWAGFLWQEQEIFGVANASGTAQDLESFGVNLGLDITYGGFNVMGSWYDGEALGTLFFNTAGSGDRLACNATGCTELDADGFIVQGSYTFNGKTKVGIGYGESNEDGNAVFGAPGDLENDSWTVGVYHDVNSWLKLVAEYTDQDSTARGEAQTFAVGGFLLW